MPDPKPERWVIALTPKGAGPPMAVRVRMLIKHASRYLGLSVDHVPDPDPAEVQAPAPPEPETPQPV